VIKIKNDPGYDGIFKQRNNRIYIDFHNVYIKLNNLNLRLKGLETFYNELVNLKLSSYIFF